MNAEENIKKYNIILPKAPDPVGSYLATKKVNNLLYISGQISMDNEGNLIKGKLGKDLDTNNSFSLQNRIINNINQTEQFSDFETNNCLKILS